MPRRRALTEAQLEGLLALPADETLLIRHWTLDRADSAAVDRRRSAHNQLGYALQLCAFRYPGRLLRPGEAIPEAALRSVAGQIHVGAGTLAAYAARPQTRREQLDGLREAFGFRMFSPGHGREMLAWLLPVALATTDAPAVAAALMDELRRRRIVAPGPSVVERLVAAALVLAERHVAVQLTRALTPERTAALDVLLDSEEGTAPLDRLRGPALRDGSLRDSVLAWARQPPGAPGHKALKRVVEQLGALRGVGLDPACGEGVHPERLRKLAREGGRYTAQHLRALSPLRRRATLVATVSDTTTRLTDDGVGLFDRAIGRLFRRAEAGEERTVLRDARAVNDKVRLFAKLGAALIEAEENGTDLSRSDPSRRAKPRRRLRGAPSPPPWAGRSWPPAWPRPSAWRGRTTWTCRPWPRAPGRCCTVSAPPSSTPSGCAPSPPRPRPCAGSSCCKGCTRAAAGSGPRACPPPSCAPIGATPYRPPPKPAPPSTAAPGRRRPCSPCATGCAPATSGSRAAASGAPSRTSSSRRRCSPSCARPGRCPWPCPRRRRSTWPNAAPCWTGAWRRSKPKPRPTDWRTCGSGAAYPRQNGLALALREIGRLERTLYTLDWLERPPLRRQATAELNKGESRNALARAVCFHRLGRLHDRTAVLQQHRASGLALVTAAIALWNTVYLGRALDALRRRGEAIPDALLAHIAPLGWQHINLTGDYLWGADAALGPDGFRPLRSGGMSLADAV